MDLIYETWYIQSSRHVGIIQKVLRHIRHFWSIYPVGTKRRYNVIFLSFVADWSIMTNKFRRMCDVADWSKMMNKFLGISNVAVTLQISRKWRINFDESVTFQLGRKWQVNFEESAMLQIGQKGRKISTNLRLRRLVENEE